jgi:hypothetical protein
VRDLKLDSSLTGARVCRFEGARDGAKVQNMPINENHSIGSLLLSDLFSAERPAIHELPENAARSFGTARRLKILSAYDDNFSEIGAISEKSIRLYAMLHNADFEVRRNFPIGRPPAWAKVRFLIDEIRKGEHEFLLWIDADACFVRGDADILSCVRPEKDLFLVNHRVNGGMLTNFPGVHAYFERPNTGLILARSSRWSLEFLERVWNKTEYMNHPWWENAALMAEIGYWQEISHGVKPNQPDQRTLSKIGWLPLEWNSVPTEVNGEPAGITQKPIILHFAGMPNESRKREMKRLCFAPIPLYAPTTAGDFR